jgi:hypothetical protein
MRPAWPRDASAPAPAADSTDGQRQQLNSLVAEDRGQSEAQDEQRHPRDQRGQEHARAVGQGGAQREQPEDDEQRNTLKKTPARVATSAARLPGGRHRLRWACRA